MNATLIKDRKQIGGYSWISDSLFDIQSNLSHTEFRTFLCLVRHANKDGECFPSLNTIADKCEMSKTTVIKNLKDLVKKGLIEIERRVIERNGRFEFTSNLYKIKNFIMKSLGRGSTDEISGSQNHNQGSSESDHKGISNKGISKEDMYEVLNSLETSEDERKEIETIVLSSKKKINNLENYIKAILVNLRKQSNSKSSKSSKFKTRFHNFEQKTDKYSNDELMNIWLGDPDKRRERVKENREKFNKIFGNK